MPKLTETTNDKLKNGGLHILPPHEPTKVDGPWDIPAQVSIPEQTKNATPKINPKLKVALIGTAPSSRLLAPYNDPSWQIWVCSPGNMNGIPRADRWFEIHGSLLWEENQHYGVPYIEFLKNLKIPVYMQDQRYCPNAISYPKDEMVKEFGPYYFTSSFAWMAAMAIHEGASEIAFFGVDMASRDEYILQRPGIYHFFIEAKKRGIKVSAPYESDLMQPPGLYGFSEVTPFGRKLIARTKELKDRLNALRAEQARVSQNITYLEGALEDIDYVTAIWGGVQNNSGLDIDRPKETVNG